MVRLGVFLLETFPYERNEKNRMFVIILVVL